MPFDPALEEKMNELYGQWEADEPGSTDIDTPPTPASGPGSGVEMEGLDFTDSTPSAGGELPAAPATDALVRLRDDEPAETPKPPGVGPVGMKAPPSSPASDRPDPSSLDWKGLDARLKAAQLGQSSSRNYENMFANIGAQSGYRPNPHAGDVGVDMVKGELDLAKAKQGQESHDLNMAKAKSANAAKAAMADPNSLQSQKARDAIKSYFGDSVPLPKGFDNYSADDIQQFASSGKLAQVAQMKNAAADDARKSAGAKEKADAEAGALENSRKAFAKDLIAMGVDPQHASQQDIDRALSKNRADAASKAASADDKRADAMLALALSGEKRKAGDYEALGETIPFAEGELKYTGKGTPREEDRKKAQEIAGGWNAALAGMNNLEGSLKAFATGPSVDTKRDVDSKVRVVSSALNAAIGGGAMSETEAVAMAQALGADVTSASGIQAAFEHLVGNDANAARALLTRLGSVRQSALVTARGKLKSYRYEMAGGGDTPPKADPDTPPIPEESRTINGVKYRKKGGKWVTDA